MTMSENIYQKQCQKPKIQVFDFYIILQREYPFFSSQYITPMYYKIPLIGLIFTLLYISASSNEDVTTAEPIPAQTRIHEFYTNKEASDCFSNIALQTCHAEIKNCTQDPTCVQQLSLYQSCAFGVGEDVIFNGYCFRKWQQNSFLTRPMVQCFVKECNLLYNSIIGVQELFECSQEVIANQYQFCGEECGNQLNKIRDSFGVKTIQELFRQKLEDQSAQYIVDLIKQKCINPHLGQKKQADNLDKGQDKQSESNQKNEKNEQELDRVIQQQIEKQGLIEIVGDDQQL